MFCLGAAMYGDVVCNSNTSLALFEDLIHLFLEDRLGNRQGQREVAGNGIF